MDRRRALMAAQGEKYEHGTWEDLFRAIDSGTYTTEYAQGETLELDLGSTLGVLHMEISNFNVDNLADNSGKAPITLVSRELMLPTRQYNPQQTGNAETGYTEGTGCIGCYDKSSLRSWFHNTVLPAIPASVSARIVEVKKSSTGADTTGARVRNSTTTEKVFPPSMRECGRNSQYNESENYSSTYWSLDSAAKRQRTQPNSTTVEAFRIRTGNDTSTNNTCIIPANGSISSGITKPSQNYLRTLLCFCVG